MEDLEDVKVIIRSLLISSNKAMTIEDLARDYKNTEGNYCPFRPMGYPSFIAFLQSIPDTVTVLSNGLVRAVSTEATAHIQQLVALQKKPRPRPRKFSSYGRSSYSSYRSSGPPRYSGSSSYRSSGPPCFSGSSSYRSSYQSTPSSSYYRADPTPSRTIDEHFAKVREAKQLARDESLGISSSRSFTHPPAEADDGPPPRRNIVAAGDSTDSNDSFYERFKSDHDNDDLDPVIPRHQNVNCLGAPELKTQVESVSTVNDKIKTNLKQLLKSYPEGLWACELPSHYQKKFGISLDWNELGFDSVVQMAHDLMDIFICKRVQGGDWMLYDASLPTLPHEPLDSKPAPVVPELVKGKLYNLVKMYPTGIRAEQLVKLYEEHYGRSLCSEAPGFDSPDSLFLSIQDTVVHMRHIRKECYIYPGSAPAETHLPILEVDVNFKKALGLYPEEVMGPGESYPHPTLPPDLEIGEFIELEVAEIYNPLKFWIILRAFFQELEKMMDDLQVFYEGHEDKYCMPRSTVNVGQCCVAVYEKEWHRASIKSVGDMIELLFVDYGTVAKVQPTDLRFIHQDFCNLPVQAIRSSMCGIQPPNGRKSFTREANEALLKLVAGKSLIGVVQQFDREEPFIELFLVDTGGPTDIHLNDVMVSENHAVFKAELLKSDACEASAPACVAADDLSNASEASAHARTAADVLTQTSQSSINVPCIPPTDCSTTSQSQSQPIQSQAPTIPPPGFVAPGIQAQAIPPAFNMAGLGGYGFNPTLAMAYASATGYLPQVNTTLLMQQQMQQQLQQHQQQLNMYYHNLYQQAITNILAAQSKASNSCQESPLHQTRNIPDMPFINESRIDSKNVSLESATTAPSDVPTRANVKREPAIKTESLTSADESSSSENQTLRKRRIPIKKRKEIVSALPYRSVASTSSGSADDLVVDCLEDLLVKSDSQEVSSSASSCRNNAPDIVRSVGSLSLSHQDQESPLTNFWKVIDVNGVSVHLFNLNRKPFMSTGELARNFTQFSSGGTLVRVLENKEMYLPYKKVTRQEALPMFSALDGYSVENVKSFDLSRNKNGNVIGLLHLTPLANIPAMLVSVGVSVPLVKDFQKIRDAFNPLDDYWTQ